MKQVLPASRGFTLIEILMVIAIIGILATIAVPMYRDYHLRAKAVSLVTEVKTAAQAFRTFKMENNTYPADTAAGVTPPEALSFIGEFFSTTPSGTGNISSPASRRGFRSQAILFPGRSF